MSIERGEHVVKNTTLHTHQGRQDKKIKNKTVVIGIDGAAYNLIRSWAAEGKLPFIRGLMDKGCSGTLKSTIPPLSPVAWPSFYTGVNPGKHGIFDFLGPSYTDRFGLKFNNRTDCLAVPLWKYLNRAGYKVGMFNVPMTFPPEKIDGFMVSGFDTPDINSDFTYPSELMSEIINKVGKYILDMAPNRRMSSNPETSINSLLEMTKVRERAALYLLDKYQLDLYVLVFTSTDRAQHTLWKYHDPEHPAYKPGFEDGLLRIYQRVDEAIGKVLRLTDDSTNVIIMSDHGSEGIYRTVDLNKWFIDNGYLHVKELNVVSKYVAIGAELLGRFRRRVFRRNKSLIWFLERIIDWRRTKAFYLGAWGNIFLNVKGREPQGIVNPGKEYESVRDDIVRELQRLRDPQTGKPVIRSIFKKEDIFAGEHIKDAPDLVILWNEHYNGAKTALERMGPAYKKNGVFKSCGFVSGDHNQDGIFVFKSPFIKKNEHDRRANIVDICPTILHMMGLEVPKIMDGKVLSEMFTEDYLRGRPVRYADGTFEQIDSKPSTYSARDAKKIADKLRDLGYLG